MVREESHLDEMRAAIRGDFERLERRLGAQDLMHVTEPDEPDEPESPETPDEQARQARADEAPERPTEQPRRSWLDRVLGR